MPRKISLLLLLFIFAGLTAEAQGINRAKNRYLNRVKRHGQGSFILGSGISSYFGDLKDNQSLDAKLNISLGAQIRYKDHLSFRGELTYYRIAGDDANNDVVSGLPSRNLSFRADNIEFNAAAVLYLFPRHRTYSYQKPIIANPYIFGGVGFTTVNPKAEYQGEWYKLRPLQTQGISYSGFTLALPLGAGVSFKVNKDFDVSLEAGYRITFMDQLDDASRPDYVPLSNFSDPIAAALSDRRNEVGIIPGAPEGAGVIRGNPSKDDHYLLFSVKVQYYIPMPGERRYRRAFYQ